MTPEAAERITRAVPSITTQGLNRGRANPRYLVGACALAAAFAATSAKACPALDAYYPKDDSQWPAVLESLRGIEDECLRSAEYFALLGAAEMGSGLLVSALESFERALLLDPANGAAQIDYAEALYLSGQLFPALELNRAVLQRPDTPPPLAELLDERQSAWRQQTRRTELAAEIGLGYDNNLNGGPARNAITLTLSGEPVQLTLDDAFRPVEGAYGSLRLSGSYEQLTADHSHQLVGALRSRNSEYSEFDLLQLDWRYNFGGTHDKWRWDLTGGTSHLLWGGSPLYSVTEGRYRLQPDRQGCRPLAELAAQHQLYHGQSVFTGLESSALLGVECRSGGIHGLELGYINNSALKDLRPGGDRDGTRLRAYLERPLGPGLVSANLGITALDDAAGYSDLLAGNARRKVITRTLRLQYRQLLPNGLEYSLGYNHQEQDSNLDPFVNTGTAFELGLRVRLQ
jgi:tetratricopeptide (TPR) repeat protein